MFAEADDYNFFWVLIKPLLYLLELGDGSVIGQHEMQAIPGVLLCLLLKGQVILTHEPEVNLADAVV